MPYIQQRELTPGQWTAQNPVLLKGEIGWESGSVPKAKKGDGTTAWNSLPYAIVPGAPIVSPTFTGDPKAPTPATADNDTSIATTAFVKAAIAALIAGSPGLLDTLDELAAALGDDPNFAATMATQLSLKAPLVSPVFTGNPTVPTQPTSDNDTSAASTAFVKAVVASYAPLASPIFTGNPTAPTQTAGDNDTSIATTAFVQTALAARPYASGRITGIAAPAINFGSFTAVPITFPVGRFSTPPIVNALASSARIAVEAGTATTGGVTLNVWNNTGTASGVLSLDWTAITPG